VLHVNGVEVVDLVRVLVFALALAGVALLTHASASAEPAAEAQAVTIFARPTVLGWNQLTTLFGAARGAGGHDIVEVQARECGSGVFRTLVEAHVNAGGGWTTSMGALATTTFRAKWRGAVSSGVTIRKQAGVSLVRKRSGPGFVVAVTAKRSFWRKRVEIQRRRGGGWRTVKTVVLTDSVRSTGVVSASEATFRLAVPKGTQLRAVVPSAQTRPCYVQSVSRVLRT
jgi:hypothetical protein